MNKNDEKRISLNNERSSETIDETYDEIYDESYSEADINHELLHNIFALQNRLYMMISKVVEECDLTISEFNILIKLLREGEFPTQKLAESIYVTSGTITYLVDKLVNKRYIYREQSLEDRRIYIVGLTKTGEQFISYIYPEYEKYLSQLFAFTSENSKVQMINESKMFLEGLKSFDNNAYSLI